MNKIKSIDIVLAPPAPHMVGDGFRVHNFFPDSSHIGLQGMSPFFLMDYNSKVEFPGTNTPRGVGVHPHRGFETVTLAYHGKVAHHDSTGNSGIIGEGDVQWMTAASGVLHKEYHEKEWSTKGGTFQMVQLWVNLPAKYKMSAPKYQALENKTFGRYVSPDGLAEVEVIAGNFNGQLGSAFTFTPIEMYNVKLKTNAVLDVDLPAHYNTGFLVVEGTVKLNGQSVATDHFALFAHDGTQIQVKATENAVVLILSGEPINEPIMPYGPFLMNTKQEIIQAYEDLNSGKFGYLED